MYEVNNKITNIYDAVNPILFGIPVSFDAIPKKHRAAIAQKTLGKLIAKNPEQDKTVSVDTIAITIRINTLFDVARYDFKPISIYKGAIGQRKEKTPSKRFQRVFESITGAKIKLTYTRKFGHWLTVETSLPKFTDGSNLRVLSHSERIEAVKELSSVVSERLGFPIDLFAGNFSRLDLFQHIRFGSEQNLILAVESLKQLKVSFRKLETLDFRDSATWRTTGKKKTTHKLTVYNKTAERKNSGETIPNGILKIESQYFDNDFYRGNSVKSLLSDAMIRQLYFAHLWQ